MAPGDFRALSRAYPVLALGLTLWLMYLTLLGGGPPAPEGAPQPLAAPVNPGDPAVGAGNVSVAGGSGVGGITEGPAGEAAAAAAAAGGAEPPGSAPGPGALPEGGVHGVRRIMHIITTLEPTNTINVRGQQRASTRMHTFEYLLRGSRELCDYGFDVSVRIVAGWAAESKRAEFEAALGACTGGALDLDIWENAIPESLDAETGEMRPFRRTLARQHRFLVKRELENYDLFVAFEDDIYVGVAQVLGFLEMSAALKDLADKAGDAPAGLPGVRHERRNASQQPWQEPLKRDDYLAILPGFARVEAIADAEPHADAAGARVPFSSDSACCPLPHPPSTTGRPVAGGAGALHAWEWGDNAMAVRQLPGPLGWVALLPALSGGWLGGFTGKGPDHTFVEKGAHAPGRFGQQAGWMATREQVKIIDARCDRGFLPPPDEELGAWHLYGTVEFWSGGLQLFGARRCRMARVLSLASAEAFERHLLFHASNNKQVQYPGRMQPVSKIYGELRDLVRRAGTVRPLA